MPTTQLAGYTSFRLNGVLNKTLSLAYHISIPKTGLSINLSIIAASLGTVIGLFLGSFPYREPVWSRFAWGVGRLFVCLAIICAAAYAIDQPQAIDFLPVIPHFNHNQNVLFFAIAALSLGISGAGHLVMSAIDFFVLFFVYIDPLARRHPEAAMVGMLMGALRGLSSDQVGISTVTAKKNICRSLQDAASWLQRELYESVATSDTSIDALLKERFDRSAAYFRTMQLRVIFADSKTERELRKAVAECISAVLQGEYDLLPESDPVLRAKRTLIHSVFAFARAIIVGAIPIGCVAGCQYAGLKLSSGFSNWAIIFSICWAAITVISVSDPLYRTKLTEMREFIATVRGTGG